MHLICHCITSCFHTINNMLHDSLSCFIIVIQYFISKYCPVLGQFTLHFFIDRVQNIYFIFHSSSPPNLSLTALHEASAICRKMILLLSPSEPVRPTSASADDHFVMFHTQKLNDLVGSAACPHCDTSALHVTETDTKGYVVQFHLTCDHCDAELSSVYSAPVIPTYILHTITLI